MTNKRNGYRGYVTCREFGGLQIPVPTQALILRNYCASKGYQYKLHVNENIFPHSYVVLQGLIKNLDIYEGLLATSMFMMPKNRQRRLEIYETIIGQGASLHFVLEGFMIQKIEDIEPVEEILLISALLPSSKEFLPSISTK